MATVSSSSEMPLTDLDEGLHEACGVFGCVAKTWPTELDVAHVICLGMVGLQHRLVKIVIKGNLQGGFGNVTRGMFINPNAE